MGDGIVSVWWGIVGLFVWHKCWITLKPNWIIQSDRKKRIQSK